MFRANGANVSDLCASEASVETHESENHMIDPSRPCILFFDWDNTLAVGGEVSDANREALAAARAAGHRIVLNTGRSLSFIPPAAFENVTWDGVIASCSYAAIGSADGFETIFERYLPADVLCKTLQYYRAHREALRLIRFEGRDAVISPDDEGLTDEDIVARADEMRVSNVTVGTDMTAFPDFLSEGGDLICHEGYSELEVPGMDKGTLMPLFCERFGISREQTVAFGDSINDEGMFRFAGTRVLIPGERFERTELIDVFTEGREDGVAEAMRKLGLL